MKNLTRLMTGAVLMGALMLMPSCETTGDQLDIVFPEKEDITGTTAGEVKVLTFSAAAAWSLNSDASWIKFNNDGAWLSSITGKAGDQSIEYKIEESGWGLEETTANITLKIDDQSEVIATVVRPAKELGITFYTYSSDGSYTPIDFDPTEDVILMDQNYSGEHKVMFGVKSDLDWTLEFPKWIAKDGLATEYKGNSEIKSIWFSPEYRAFEFKDKMEGNIVIKVKDHEDLSYSIPIESAGSNDLLLYNSDHTEFHFSGYGFYDLPDDQGVADTYSINLTTGATKERLVQVEELMGGKVTKDASFSNNNFIALEYVSGEGKNAIYKEIKGKANDVGYVYEKPWLQVSAIQNEELQRSWVERYTGNYSVMKYGYEIKCSPNQDEGSLERKAILIALPFKYFNNDTGTCKEVELRNVDGTLKAEFEQYIVAHFRQDGEIPLNALAYPAEALICGATMRLMDKDIPEDKAYMDARIAELKGKGFETYEGRIVYENMWELVYDHPNSSMWAAMAPVAGVAERDMEITDPEEKLNHKQNPLGSCYIPEAFKNWIDMDVDDFTVVTMRPDPKDENFQELDGYIVLRPFDARYELVGEGDDKEWITILEEPKSYQVIRCRIKSNKIPDNWDEIKPDRAPSVK